MRNFYKVIWSPGSIQEQFNQNLLGGIWASVHLEAPYMNVKQKTSMEIYLKELYRWPKAHEKILNIVNH